MWYIRHDSLGSYEHTLKPGAMLDKIGDVITNTWRHAPIIYEFSSQSLTISNADAMLKATHGSIIHDNPGGTASIPASQMEDLLRYMGYRFIIRQAEIPQAATAPGSLNISLTWNNVGYAPAYPRMGHVLQAHFYLTDEGSVTVSDWPLTANVADWLPAHPYAAARRVTMSFKRRLSRRSRPARNLAYRSSAGKWTKSTPFPPRASASSRGCIASRGALCRCSRV